MRSLPVLILVCVLLSGCATGAKRQQQQRDVEFHYRMGMAALQDNNVQGALVEFRSARDIAPKDVKVLFALGHALFVQGEYEEARKTMERILKIDPDNGETINYLGNVYERLGRTDDAIAAFQRAASLPSYLTPHYALHNLGRVYFMQGDTKRAEQAYLAALKRVPEYHPARVDLAKLYLDTKNWQRAVQEWVRLIDLLPDLYDARYYLAQAYVGMNEPMRARQELKLFLSSVEPENPLIPDAQALLSRLEEKS